MSATSTPPAGASRVLRNFSFLTLGKVVSDLSTFLLFVVLSRVYGEEGIGRYSLAMALTGFFSMFGDFGLYNLSITELSRSREGLKAYLGRILSLRLCLTALGFSALVLVSPWLPFPPETRTIILLVGAYQFLYRLFNGFAAVFVAHERMGTAAVMEIALRVAIAGGAILVALSGAGLDRAMVVLPVATGVVGVVCFGLVARRYALPVPAWHVPSLVATARRAGPYMMSSVLFQFSARIDVLFLGLILGEAASGVYNVAYRVVFLLTFAYYYASISILPAASRLFVSSPGEMQALYRTSLRLIALTAVPAAAGIMLVAPATIRLVFGDGFTESAAILGWLSWLLVAAGFKHVLGAMLMAGDRQILRVKSQWAAAGLNVVGNLILIPVLGVRGAVIATLVSEFVLVCLLLWRAWAFLGSPGIGGRLAIGLVGSACFYVPFRVLDPQPLWVVVPASALIYGAVVLAFRDVRRTELRMLLDRVGRPWRRPGRS